MPPDSNELDLTAIDPIFSRPIGTTVPEKAPAGSSDSTAFPELGLTRSQERTAAAGAGAIAGPAVQKTIETVFPSKEMRTIEGVKKLKEQQQLMQLMQNMRDEELLRMGIQPESTPKGTTSGTKWMKNWAGMDRVIEGGVPEASAAYNRSKGQGKVSSRLTKLYGPLEPGQSIADKLLSNANAAEEARTVRTAAMPAAEAAAKARLAEATPGVFSKAASILKTPIVGGALSGAGAGLGFYEAYRRFIDGDRSGAVIAALGGISGVMAMFPGLQLPGTMGAVGAAGALAISDRLKEEPPTQEATPYELRGANHVAWPGSVSMDPKVQQQRGFTPLAP